MYVAGLAVHAPGISNLEPAAGALFSAATLLLLCHAILLCKVIFPFPGKPEKAVHNPIQPTRTTSRNSSLKLSLKLGLLLAVHHVPHRPPSTWRRTQAHLAPPVFRASGPNVSGRCCVAVVRELILSHHGRCVMNQLRLGAHAPNRREACRVTTSRR